MPALIDSGATDVAAFVNWLHGQENSGNANIKAAALFVRAQCSPRPVTAQDVKYRKISDMRYIASVVGPSVTNAEFDAALAAFIAS